MISVDGAKKNLEKKFSGIHLTKAFNFDNDFYLFLAEGGDPKYSDSYYIASKGDNRCRFFNPTEDIDKFFECTRERLIKKFD